MLNVEEGMTDEDDVEHLEWLLDKFLLMTRSDLDRVLDKDSGDIDKYILEAYLSEGT
jgi:hypothetical protein